MPRVIDAFSQFFDNDGAPLVDGWLRFLVSGTNNTDKNTYADINETVANSNPVQLDASGRCPNIFGTGAYRVISYTNDPILGVPAVQIQQFDPVEGVSPGAGFESWNSSSIYNIPDIVLGSDLELYRSITNDNAGNDPTLSPANWEQIEFEQVYNANRTYAQYERCIDASGESYTSLVANNTGNTPSTSPGQWQNNRPFDDLIQIGRAQFAYVSATQLSIAGGGYAHQGTTNQVLLINSAINHTITTPGTSQYQYIYLDDSAIITAATNIITASEIINSTTAPTYDATKKGWYNGDDLCIFAVYIDSSGDIQEFTHTDNQVLFWDPLTISTSGQTGSTNYDTTLLIPEFSREGFVAIATVTHSADGVFYWSTHETGAVLFAVFGYAAARNTEGGQFRAVTDSSQQIILRNSGGNITNVYVDQMSWFFPVRM